MAVCMQGLNIRHHNARSARFLLERQPGRSAASHRRAGQTQALLNSVLQRIRPAKRSPADDACEELLEAVQQGSTDLGRASELVDVLMRSSLPFREQLLGGGPWQVVYTRGPLLWQGFTAAGNALSKRRLGRSANKASQEYNPADRTVINRGEVLGARLYVTASGTYEPEGQTQVTPVLVKASVERGALHAFGRDILLPIRGSGYVNVAYLSEALRVLQNRSGAVTVQVREDRLQQLL